MGLFDGYGLSAFGLPILDEGLVDGLIKFPGRIVGDVEKGGVGKHGARREGCKDKGRAGGKGALKSRHNSILLLDNTLNSIYLVVFSKGGPYHNSSHEEEARG